MITVLIFLLMAVLSYVLGGFNGAILLSKWVVRGDVRKQGSGNAGLTNYTRTYGWKTAPLMIFIDVAKTVIAILLSSWLAKTYLQNAMLGRYWSMLWVSIGHDFPMLFGFKGGKGILTCGTALVMLDWRIAVIGFGAFFLGVLLTRYVSFGSILACISLPISTAIFMRSNPAFWWLLLIGCVTAGIAIWGHRTNISRLLSGTENKLKFHRNKE